MSFILKLTVTIMLLYACKIFFNLSHYANSTKIAQLPSLLDFPEDDIFMILKSAMYIIFLYYIV